MEANGWDLDDFEIFESTEFFMTLSEHIKTKNGEHLDADQKELAMTEGIVAYRIADYAQEIELYQFHWMLRDGLRKEATDLHERPGPGVLVIESDWMDPGDDLT